MTINLWLLNLILFSFRLLNLYGLIGAICASIILILNIPSLFLILIWPLSTLIIILLDLDLNIPIILYLLVLRGIIRSVRIRPLIWILIPTINAFSLLIWNFILLMIDCLKFINVLTSDFITRYCDIIWAFIYGYIIRFIIILILHLYIIWSSIVRLLKWFIWVTGL